MRKPEIGYSAARLLVGRPTITKYFDQRQLGAAHGSLRVVSKHSIEFMESEKRDVQ
jgi:hypothetical protein